MLLPNVENWFLALSYECDRDLSVVTTRYTILRLVRLDADAPKARKDFQTRFANDSTRGESLLVCGFNARGIKYPPTTRHKLRNTHLR